jgi:hypothetical protein
MAGAVLIARANVTGADVPQVFEAVTVMFPAVGPAVIVAEVVP